MTQQVVTGQHVVWWMDGRTGEWNEVDRGEFEQMQELATQRERERINMEVGGKYVLLPDGVMPSSNSTPTPGEGEVVEFLPVNSEEETTSQLATAVAEVIEGWLDQQDMIDLRSNREIAEGLSVELATMVHETLDAAMTSLAKVSALRNIISIIGWRPGFEDMLDEVLEPFEKGV